MSGAREQIVDVFLRERVLELAARHSGFVGAELQVPLDPGGPLVVTASWRDATDYDGWLADPARTSSSDALAGLLADEPASGTLYRIAHAVRRAQP